MKPSDGLVKAGPINQLLKWQSVTLAITVLIVFVWQGQTASIAYLYGGGIAVGNTLLQKWHLLAAAKTAKADASMNLGRAYRCVAERWALTIVLFAIGFTVFVPAEILLAGFVVAQVVVLFGHYNRA
ncbi:MAG: ATP synthase subunit I [Piscirickettsiaceae bacterium]|nr:ATP synthase subunit I [Piscirickettsiaceae bacterium]